MFTATSSRIIKHKKSITLLSSIAFTTTSAATLFPSKCEQRSSSSSSTTTSSSSLPYHHQFFEEEIEEDEESRNFHETLQHHKRNLKHYKESWNWHNANSRIPTVSWPLDIPNESDIPTLTFDLSFCQRRRQYLHKNDNNDDDDDDDDDDDNDDNDPNKRYCNNLQFRIASYMLLQQDIQIQQKAFTIIQTLAENETHPDSICAYATCLNDGRAGAAAAAAVGASGREPNPKAAVSWWKHASDKYDHVQSTYEMGVALYTGEGVAENENLAVEYFRKAAECGHAGASYMLGDCLLDGVGVERDRGEALEWLVTAAELGHRGARSRVLAVLEMKEGDDFGSFTDASRQSLVDLDDGTSDDNDDNDDDSNTDADATAAASDQLDNNNNKEGKKIDTSGKQRDEKEKPYSGHPVTFERRFTIGGGARNPTVLARRKTIVTESRQVE